MLEMPRGAQVIYPKDLGADLHARRHRPGHPGVRDRRRIRRPVDDDAPLRRRHRRLRAARGLRQPGPQATCELPRRATCSSATTWSSPTATRASTAPDRSTGSSSTCPSRGRSSPTPRRVLRPGGMLVAYTPSITQAAQVREALRGTWIDARTIEVLHRGWHIEGQAVRPDHRMVAHTGVPHRRPLPRQGAGDAGRPARSNGSAGRSSRETARGATPGRSASRCVRSIRAR